MTIKVSDLEKTIGTLKRENARLTSKVSSTADRSLLSRERTGPPGSVRRVPSFSSSNIKGAAERVKITSNGKDTQDDMNASINNGPVALPEDFRSVNTTNQPTNHQENQPLGHFLLAGLPR